MSRRRKYDANGNRPGTRTSTGRLLTGGTSLTRMADRSLPDHYIGPAGVGFGHGLHGTPSVRGILQTPLKRSDLDELVVTETDLVVGRDRRLYEPRLGLINCMAEVRATNEAGQVYVDTVDWKSFPPMGELAFLFDRFFSKYDREVLMIVGKKRNGNGWLYHTPMQEGSVGLITWSSTEKEMAWFSKHAKWIGTIHVHPGADCTPSKTDVDDWAEPEKSGLHVIFGRTQNYTINGAIANRTFEVDAGTLASLKRIPVEWTTSGHRPLDEILLRPKPVQRLHTYQSKTLCSRVPIRPTGVGIAHVPTMTCNTDFVDWVFNQGGMLRIEKDQLASLRMILYNGSYYMVTLAKWCEIQDWAKGMVELPLAKRLSIYTVRGDEI